MTWIGNDGRVRSIFQSRIAGCDESAKAFVSSESWISLICVEERVVAVFWFNVIGCYFCCHKQPQNKQPSWNCRRLLNSLIDQVEITHQIARNGECISILSTNSAMAHLCSGKILFGGIAREPAICWTRLFLFVNLIFFILSLRE